MVFKDFKMGNDINIAVIDRFNISHVLVGPTDMNMNVMELCKSYGLPVEGTCGGMALCASCQCYIESNHSLPPASQDENNMLDEAFFVKSNSRLGCQIKLTEEIDGLIIRLAPESE
jgi:2Fe-2S ferredoxin